MSFTWSFGPRGRVVPREGFEEGTQHSVAGLLTLVLAAVVVALVRPPSEIEATSVAHRPVDDRALILGSGLELLQEGRLAIASVTGDDDEPKLPREDRWHQISIERRLNVGLLAEDIEAPGSGVATATLAVECQQMETNGLVLGSAHRSHHLRPGVHDVETSADGA